MGDDCIINAEVQCGFIKKAMFISVILVLVSVGSVGATTLDVPGTYPTIQDAINAANPGDTINVSAGTYNENVDVNKGLITNQNYLPVPHPGSLGRVIETNVSGSGDMPVLQLSAIAGLSFVKVVRPPSKSNFNVINEGAGVIKADLANVAGYTGQGVKVAIIDCGFDITNPEISGNIVESKSFRADGDITGGNCGHGTATAKIVVDVAPNVSLYLYNFGIGVEWYNVVDYAVSQGVDIISFSGGWFNQGNYDGTSPYIRLDQRVDYVSQSGILWINSGANYAEGYWEGTFTDTDDDRFHEFTTRPVDEFNGIYATAPDGTSSSVYGSVSFFGTSASAPHVAGATALLLEQNPSLTPGQIQTLLEDNAVDLGVVGKENQTGAGKLTSITSLNLSLLSSGGPTQINSCTTITSPGTYVLNQSISSSGNCITIESSDVIFDGASYNITGFWQWGYGIYVYKSGTTLTNVTVRNTTVTGWQYGIYYRNAESGSIANNTALNNWRGIYFYDSSSNTITNNTFKANSNGLHLGSYSYYNNIWKNTFYDTGINIHYQADNNYCVGVGNYYDVSVPASQVVKQDCGPTPGADIHVNRSAATEISWGGTNATYSSIREAFYNVNANRTITLQQGTGPYPETTETIRDYVTLDCQGELLNGSGTGYGVHINGETGITVKNCVVENYDRGIYLYNSSNNTLSGNIMSGNAYNFFISGDSVSHYVHDIDVSNTVNGKPIYYLVGVSDQVIDSSTDVGYIGVVNGINVTIRDLALTKNRQGVLFVNTTNSSVLNVDVSNNGNGIWLKSSSNNTIANNTITNNNASDYWYGGCEIDWYWYGWGCRIGISLYSSSNNIITNNTITNNNVSDYWYGWGYGIGISLYTSSNNTVTNNNASNNDRGIWLYSSSSNTIANNTITNNNVSDYWYGGCEIDWYWYGGGCRIGISLHSSSNNTIANNTASNNTYGILLGSSSSNTITNNTVTNNNASDNWYGGYGTGIYLWGSSNNTITNNTANSNNDEGIYLSLSSGNTLTGNNASNNRNGILLSSSSNYNTLTNNTASSNSAYGIDLSSSSSNVLTGNIMSANTRNFDVGGSFVQTIDTTNTVDGKPIYYLVGVSDRVIDSSTDAGYVGVVNSNNVTVRDLTLTKNGQGMLFVNTSNSSVLNVNASNNGWSGIYLYSSSNNTITNNTANFNGYGIYLAGVSRINNISNNVINSTTRGFYFDDAPSYYNTMDGNTVNGDTYYHLVNENGMVLENLVLTAERPSNLGWVSVINSTKVTLRNLMLANNTGGSGLFLYQTNNSNMINVTTYSTSNGIYFQSSSSNTLTNSNVSNNDEGISLLDSSNNTIANNTITDNNASDIRYGRCGIDWFWDGWDRWGCGTGISLHSSSNNIITNNNASNNNDGIWLYTSSNNTIANNTVTNNNVSDNWYGWGYGTGISLYTSSNNTITNNNASNNDHGIWLWSSSSNTLTNNTVMNNNASDTWYGWEYGTGISLSSSSNNTITNNNASNNWNGISLSSSSSNTLTNNTMSLNTYNFWIGGYRASHYVQTIDASNSVDGKPIYYLVGAVDQVIDSDTGAGYVGVVNGINVTVKDLTLAKNGQGVLFSNTSNSSVLNVNASNNGGGIYLYSSSNNTIANNTANLNNWQGIYIESSSNNTLTNNTVSNNSRYGWGYGIWLDSSSNNEIYLNNFINNTLNARSTGSNNVWNSPKQIPYTYNGSEYVNRLGNYWSDYSGNDTNNDGIGDTVYSIDGEADDYYPLMQPFEVYTQTPSTTEVIMNETTSSNSTLYETIISQNATLNTSVAGDLSGSLNFTSLEIVLVNSGSFAGKGFSKGNWTAEIEGNPYDGYWQGMLFKKPGERMIYLKGMVSGGLKGIVEGYLIESANGSGVYDQYQAAWTISQIGTDIVFAKVDLSGTINYQESVEYLSELYALQTFIEGEASGHYNGSLSIVLTHVRIDNETNPYYGEGFSIISYVSEYGSGAGWTYDKAASPVKLSGLFSGPLFGIVSAILGESGPSRTLDIKVYRVDIGKPPKPDLKLQVWGPQSVSPGQRFSYVLEISNQGLLRDAKNVSLRFDLSPHITFKDASPGFHYDSENHTVFWRIADIKAKEKMSFSVTVEANWGLQQGTIIQNAAYIYDTAYANIYDPATEKQSPHTFYHGINWNSDQVPGQKLFAENLDASLRESYLNTDPFDGSFHTWLAWKGVNTKANYLNNAEGDGWHPIAFAHSGGTQTLIKKIEAGNVTTDYVVLASPALLDQTQLANLVTNYGVKKVIIIQSERDILNLLQVKIEREHRFEPYWFPVVWKFFLRCDRLLPLEFVPWNDHTAPNHIAPAVTLVEAPRLGGVQEFLLEGKVCDMSTFLNENNVNPDVIRQGGETFWIGGARRSNKGIFLDQDVDSDGSFDIITITDNFPEIGGLFDFPYFDYSIKVHSATAQLLKNMFLSEKYPFDGSIPGLKKMLWEKKQITSSVTTAHDPNIKYGPEGFISPGQKLNYTVEYENEGEGIAFGVYFTDTMDEDLNDSTLEIGPVIAISQNATKNGTVIAPPGVYNPNTRTITWFVGEVGPGEGGYANLNVSARSDAEEGTEIINYATVYFPSVPEETRTNGIVSIVDITPPKYSNVNQSESSVTAGEVVEVYAHWQDGVQLDYAWLATNESGTWQNVSYLELSGNDAWSNFTIQTTEEGVVYWRIHANDTAGHENVTPMLYFDVLASSSPPPTNGGGGGGGGGGGATSFEVWIKDVLVGQTFDLDIDDEDIPYINGLSLTAKQDIYSSKLSITDMDKKPWSSMEEPDASVYRYFKVSYDKDNYVESASFKFSINKSWLKDNDIDPNSVLLYHYTTTWEELDTEILKEDNESIYFEATTSKFSYFSIGGEVDSGYKSLVEEEVNPTPEEEKPVEPPEIDTPTPAPPVETPEPEQDPVKAPEATEEKGGICGPTAVVLLAMLALVFRRRRTLS